MMERSTNPLANSKDLNFNLFSLLQTAVYASLVLLQSKKVIPSSKATNSILTYYLKLEANHLRTHKCTHRPTHFWHRKPFDFSLFCAQQIFCAKVVFFDVLFVSTYGFITLCFLFLMSLYMYVLVYKHSIFLCVQLMNIFAFVCPYICTLYSQDSVSVVLSMRVSTETYGWKFSENIFFI